MGGGVRDSAAAADRSPRLGYLSPLASGHRRARSLLRLTRVGPPRDPSSRARSVSRHGRKATPTRQQQRACVFHAAQHIISNRSACRGSRDPVPIRARTRGPDLDPSSFRFRLLRASSTSRSRSRSRSASRRRVWSGGTEERCWR
jgi:hypothetical protein